MQNYIQAGENIGVIAAADVDAGEGHLIGSLFGVAQAKATSGNSVTLVRRGVFELAKTSAQAWTVGAKIYWNNTNKSCTTAASGNTLIGVAAAVAEDPSSTGLVLLDGAVR